MSKITTFGGAVPISDLLESRGGTFSTDQCQNIYNAESKWTISQLNA